MTNNVDVAKVLAQLQSMAKASKGGPSNQTGGKEGVDFASILSNAVDSVNETQKDAMNLAKTFEAGNTDIDLSEVMIALQKANISFQAITKVRNKLVSAYQDIMSIPV
ncbi:MAG: flagellar hook-basal body complex protein FliE [Thermodesulfobacteriota bacterium]|nr:flagellar hook-basal body complex protein FliE [Thermodesulfobacteriota bacterium]